MVTVNWSEGDALWGFFVEEATPVLQTAGDHAASLPELGWIWGWGHP